MIQAAYIHIPFCEHICHYCDFNKVYLKGQPVDQYLDALDKEMELVTEKTNKAKLKSIFVGGGTPTALNAKQLDQLTVSINKNLSLTTDGEYTFEANPGDLSIDKLEVLYQAGVNRLSFGVQSFNNQLLERIGRTHRAKDVYKSIETARKVGFTNINIDLIYSLPEQTLEDFQNTLDIAFSLDLEHFSAYSLIIEPKTVFYNLMRKGKLPRQGEDAEANMFRLLMEEMQSHGYTQYEISNFAREGYESIHNLTYWNNEEYFGFGAGAHSYVDGYRRSNYGPLKKYMEPLQQNELVWMENHQVTKVEKMEEEMFLGLRKNQGVSIDLFMKKYNEDPLKLFEKEIASLQEKKLLEINGDYIRLTEEGRFLGNEVFQAFIGIIA